MFTAAIPLLVFSYSYFSASLAHPAEFKVEELKTISNGVIELGIDLQRGGSITYLSEYNKNLSVINIHDMGREVQLSFYSGPDDYEPFPGSQACNTSWRRGLWPWNPIGAGDVTGNTGQVLDVRVNDNGTSMYVKSKPLQWACKNVSCECFFEKWITLDGPTASVKASLTNFRSDKTAYSGHGQELPAVYTTGYLHRLFTYSGAEPFSNAPPKELPAGPNSPNAFLATEHWAAMLDADEWGLGVYQPEATQMLGRFFGDPGTGGPTDDATGYIAPINVEILDWNIVYNFTFYLILGKLETIRSTVYQLSKNLTTCISSDFVSTREHFVLVNAADTGVPNQFWQIIMEKNDPQVIGPVCVWKASNFQTLYINASYSLSGQVTNSTSKGQVFWAKNGPNTYDEENSVSFDIKADGMWHIYEVNLFQVPAYAGVMYGLRFDPIPAGTQGSYVKLAFIHEHIH